VRALEILARPHRREMDRGRRRLAELEDGIAALRAALDALPAERAREIALVAAGASGGGRPGGTAARRSAPTWRAAVGGSGGCAPSWPS
jgi:hypothetical protein